MTISARHMLIALAVIALFALAPVISLLIAMGLANLGGCTLNEAAAHPCVFLGIDLGGFLALMAVSGWMALATLPMGAAALVFWLIVALILYIRHRRQLRV